MWTVLAGFVLIWMSPEVNSKDQDYSVKMYLGGDPRTQQNKTEKGLGICPRMDIESMSYCRQLVLDAEVTPGDSEV